MDVIAPASDMTGVSRSLSLGGPIAVDEVQMADGRAAFAVTGTPADCVRFGSLGLAGGVPDVVISGPNLGINLGDDVAYSGTVAAALEAALLDLPAAALSQQASEDGSYDATELCRFAARLVPLLGSGRAAAERRDQRERAGRRRRAASAWRRSGAGATSRSCARPARPRATGATTASTATSLRLDGEPGTDIAAVAEGYISLTPLRFDLFAEDALAALGALAAGCR